MSVEKNKAYMTLIFLLGVFLILFGIFMHRSSGKLVYHHAYEGRFDKGGKSYQTVIFTNPDVVHQWQVPEGVAKIDVLLHGGGGGGAGGGMGGGGGAFGGSSSFKNLAGDVTHIAHGAGSHGTAGGGGGGGASGFRTLKREISVAKGDLFTIHVGSGGAGGLSQKLENAGKGGMQHKYNPSNSLKPFGYEHGYHGATGGHGVDGGVSMILGAGNVIVAKAQGGSGGKGGMGGRGGRSANTVDHPYDGAPSVSGADGGHGGTHGYQAGTGGRASHHGHPGSAGVAQRITTDGTVTNLKQGHHGRIRYTKDTHPHKHGHHSSSNSTKPAYKPNYPDHPDPQKGVSLPQERLLPVHGIPSSMAPRVPIVGGQGGLPSKEDLVNDRNRYYGKGGKGGNGGFGGHSRVPHKFEPRVRHGDDGELGEHGEDGKPGLVVIRYLSPLR